jgi:hypothetical protein
MYMPLIIKYGGKIPEWLKLSMSIAFAESMSLVPIIKMAKADKKAMAANNNARKNPNVTQKVAQAASSDVERRYWEISDEGCYKFGPDGGYIKKADQTEKAILNEETAEHLVHKNGINKICRVFGLDEQHVRNYMKAENVG